MGNLRSVENALKKLGIPSVISSDPAVLNTCEKLILPGVGAFGDCMANITSRGLDVFIRQSVNEGKPLLGICLGMQMLFEESEENGLTQGFGFLKGRVIRMETDLPVPEIGWNELEFNHETALRSLLSEHPYVYYVHSYYATECEEFTVATSDYGVTVTGAVARGSVFGTQFHPEKSGAAGLAILRAFSEI
jgi:glutamine amidotransferase